MPDPVQTIQDLSALLRAYTDEENPDRLAEILSLITDAQELRDLVLASLTIIHFTLSKLDKIIPGASEALFKTLIKSYEEGEDDG